MVKVTLQSGTIQKEVTIMLDTGADPSSAENAGPKIGLFNKPWMQYKA